MQLKYKTLKKLFQKWFVNNYLDVQWNRFVIPNSVSEWALRFLRKNKDGLEIK